MKTNLTISPDIHDRVNFVDQIEHQGEPFTSCLGNDTIHKTWSNDKETRLNQLMALNRCKDAEFQNKGTDLVDLLGFVAIQISLPTISKIGSPSVVDIFVGATKSLIPHLNVQEPIKCDPT